MLTSKLKLRTSLNNITNIQRELNHKKKNIRCIWFILTLPSRDSNEFFPLPTHNKWTLSFLNIKPSDQTPLQQTFRLSLRRLTQTRRRKPTLCKQASPRRWSFNPTVSFHQQLLNRRLHPKPLNTLILVALISIKRLKQSGVVLKRVDHSVRKRRVVTVTSSVRTNDDVWRDLFEKTEY